MSPAQLKSGRKADGLTQQQAAAKLGISQAYLALLETGRRRLTATLGRKVFALYRLSPTSLPVESALADSAYYSSGLALDLAGLGYPGFSFLGSAIRKNPASVLLAALSADDLEVRVVEALPWLVSQFPDMAWDWLLREVKQREIQNRLGYVVALALRVMERQPNEQANSDRLVDVQARLDRARLVREDTLCQQSLSEAEKRWLRDARPPGARYWNLLTDLTVEHLPYVA